MSPVHPLYRPHSIVKINTYRGGGMDVVALWEGRPEQMVAWQAYDVHAGPKYVFQN